MALNRLLTYTLLFFCLHLSGQGLLIKWESPPGFGMIKYGYLYNWYVTDSIAGAGWEVPSQADWDVLLNHLGGASVAGGKLKSTSGLWNEPNTAATNEVNFSALPGGFRFFLNGLFTNEGLNGYWWSATGDGTNARRLLMSYDNASVVSNTVNKSNGFSIRLLRDSTASESGMSDGTIIPNAYKGNDGKKYDGVKIGTQVWITTNLAETKYNNGTDIIEVTVNATWTGLTTGARCSYGNDETNAVLLTGKIIKGECGRLLINK